MTDEPDDKEPESLAWIGGGERHRNFAVGLFVLTVVASFIPVVTPLPLGYLLAVIAWFVGALVLYLFGFRRVQDEFDAELATVRRAIAGLAVGYLVYQVLDTGVRLLALANGAAPGAVSWLVLGVAVVVGIMGAVVGHPRRLVWFVAAIFVGNFLVTQGLRVTGQRPVVRDPVVGLVVYLSLLVLVTGVAYALVYLGGVRWIREQVS